LLAAALAFVLGSFLVLSPARARNRE